MKKVTLSLLIVVIAISSAFAQAKNVPTVVLIGIGAKNLTFDETDFKNFKFYYTPGMVSQVQTDNKAVKGALTAFGGKTAKAIYKGEPKILEEFWDKKELRYHALLYDKNGVSCWEGTIDPEGDVLDAKGFDDMTLKDALKQYVEKEKTVEKEASGEIEILDAGSLRRGKYYNYPLAERKIPEFNTADVTGKEVSVKSIIEIGSPVLVIFFELPADIDCKAAQESKKVTLGQMMQSAGGGSVSQNLQKIHTQLFGKK
jgi:hypothetical protein